MSGEWELRPAGPEDLEALVEVYRAEDLRYRGRSEMELGLLNERIEADTRFDAANDQVVAELHGEIAAAAMIRSSAAMMAVHPDREVQGLRASVLSWVAWRQGQMGRPTCNLAVPAAVTPTVELLGRAGWELEHSHFEMVRDFSLTGPPEPAEAAPGYRLRRVDRAVDAPMLHALYDRAFQERPDRFERTLQEFDRAHTSASHFADEWSLVAETDAGEPAALLLGARRPGRAGGYIAVVGVDPGHRRHGLARTLVLAAFAQIHRSGRHCAELHVAADNDVALRVYRGVGMSQGERFDHYVRTP